MIGLFRAGWRVALMAAWTLALLAVYGGARLVLSGRIEAVPRLWHRGMRRIAGIDCTVRGQPVHGQPVIFAANHVSYLDIVLLGGLLPGSFIAKADVAAWPIIGWLAGLQDTLFIERRASRAAVQGNAMLQRLGEGRNLILFAEGTSSDGSSVLPFRSALFHAARRGRDVLVQPVSLSYTRLNGQRLDEELRPLVGWYGEMELWPHLWRYLGLGRLRAEIILHPALRPHDFASRKELAAYCRDVVAGGVAETLQAVAARQTGRSPTCRPAQGQGTGAPHMNPRSRMTDCGHRVAAITEPS